jgi:predicted 2-oxoglutarate/Fe(II)-dependent dioxygenase YbiX
MKKQTLVDEKQTLVDQDKYNIIEFEKSNIYIIENIIKDEDCDILIDFINTSKLIKEDYEKSQNVQHYLVDTKNYRSYEKINILKDMNHLLNKCMKDIIFIMNRINKLIKFEAISRYEYRKIYGPTRTHIDGISNIITSNEKIFFINKDYIQTDYKLIRNATLIFTLNDNYEGGELVFPYFDISIKLKKGSVIIFPPYWTHIHRSNPLKNDTFRYTINTWAFANN